MSLSLSQITIADFVRILGGMSAILDKAAAFAEAKKIDPSVLINARLAPDMAPLSFQVQIATDMVRGCAARLAGQTPPSYADDESTFPELKARIAKTLDYIQSVPAADVDAGETRTISLKLGPRGDVSFTARDYAFGFVIPNFYFHAATFYNILRHNGVEIGKMDFMGR